MPEHWDVVIVGSGHAGAHAAASLRQRGFTGTIAIIGAEADPPYERPPLSKDYLAGDKPFERILIRPRSFWSERNIDLLLATEATAIDPDRHALSLSNGRTLSYRHLIWAAGGEPRRLTCSGHDLAGVHTIRTRADVDRLVAELPAVRQVVVIGGGYIGLEAASALIKLGKRVILVEALDRVLARVAGEPLSRFYEAEHRAHGVDLRLGASVVCIEEWDGAASAVRLDTGEVLACEMVVVGIGIIPAVQPLLAAGAGGQNGVTVDAQCRTTLPDVFAIGDCAAHGNAYAGGATIRLESVQNAHDQAAVVAQILTGTPARYSAVPWFWSNQYDLKLQTVGLSAGFDQAVVRGDPAERSFSVVYLRGGKVIALDCVNTVKDYVQGKALVERGLVVAPARLADTSAPLKELVQAL